jgi:peroxiredoxin
MGKTYIKLIVVLILCRCFAAAHAKPLTGEIAPFVSLSQVTSEGVKPWKSRDFLGNDTLVYLLAPPHYPARDLNRVLSSLSISPAWNNVKFYIVLREVSGPAEFQKMGQWQLLQDNQGSLSSYYASKLSRPVAVVIGKAGFLRLIQPVTTSSDWQKVMAMVKKTQVSPDVPCIQVGQKAPDFIIRDMNGAVRSLHQLHGKKNLLLTFFPKCFTFTCGMQLSSLRDSQSALTANNLEIWGVSVDEAEGARGQKAFAGYLHLPFPLLPDPGHQLCLLYGSVVSPDQMSSRMSVLIDKNGIVRWIDKQIDPRHYGEDVLVKMKELGMG